MATKGFNLTAVMHVQGPVGTKAVADRIKKDLSGIKANVQIGINNSTSQRINAVNRELMGLRTNLEAVEKAARGTAASLNSINANFAKNATQTNNAAVAQKKLEKDLKKTAKAAHESATEMEEFGRVSGLAIRRFAGFTIASTSLLALTGSISSAVKEAITFQREVVRIGQATDTTVKGLKSLTDEVGRLSMTLGVSSAELLGAARILAQAGLSATETRQALEALAKADLSPSFNSIEETTEGVIAAMRQFKITAQETQDVLGSINEVSAKFAVESEDIIQAIRRTGGVFAAAAGDMQSGQQSLQEFVALFTSVRATTRESAESIATGLRTIFTRLQRKDTLEALDAIGVELLDLEGKFIGPYKAIGELNRVLSTIDTRDPLFSQITEELGGFRQIGKTIPLIKQFATAQEALKAAQTGQKSLDEDAAQAQEALQVQYAKTREKFLEMIREIANTDTFQGVAKSLLGIADAFIQVGNAIKPVLPLIATFAAFKAVQTVAQFSTGFVRGVKSNGGAAGLGERLGGGNVERTVAAQTVATRANTQTINQNTQSEIADTRNKNSVLSANTKAIIDLTTAIRALQLGGAGTNIVAPRGPRRRASGGHIHGPRQRFATGGVARYGLPFAKRNKVRVAKGSPDYIRTGSTKENNRFGIPNVFGAAFLRSPSGNVGDLPRQSAGSVQIVNPISKKASNYKYNLMSGFLSQTMASGLEKGIESDVVSSIQRQAGNIAGQLGVTERTTIDQKFLKNINIDNVSGNIFEGILSSLGSPYDSNRSSNATFDFPKGLGEKLGAAFGIPGDIITDARNTGNQLSYLGLHAKIKKLIEDRAKVRALTGNNPSKSAGLNIKTNFPSKFIGNTEKGISANLIKNTITGMGLAGDISKDADKLQEIFGNKIIVRVAGRPKLPNDTFATPDILRADGTYKKSKIILLENLTGDQGFNIGGQLESSIPALTEPGELVFGPRAAQQAGYKALEHFNKTGDARGLKPFDTGDLYQVPGSGRGDSYSSMIPEGSYVIRRDSAENSDFGGVRKLPKRFKRGGNVSRFATGSNGPVGKEERRIAAQQEIYLRWWQEINKGVEKVAKELNKSTNTVLTDAQADDARRSVSRRADEVGRAKFTKDFLARSESPVLDRILEESRDAKNQKIADRNAFLAERFAKSEPRGASNVATKDFLSIQPFYPTMAQRTAERQNRYEDIRSRPVNVGLRDGVRAGGNYFGLSQQEQQVAHLLKQKGNTTKASIQAAKFYTINLQAGTSAQKAWTTAINQAAAQTKAVKQRAGVGGMFPAFGAIGKKFGFNRSAVLDMSEEAVSARAEKQNLRNQRLAIAGTTAALLSTQVGQFLPQDNAYSAAAGGALTGATTGFALASVAAPAAGPFAPLVLAASAAGGAIMASVDAYNSAAEEINRNRLTKSLDELSQRINEYFQNTTPLEDVLEGIDKSVKEANRSVDFQDNRIDFTRIIGGLANEDDVFGFAGGTTAGNRIDQIYGSNQKVGGFNSIMSKFLAVVTGDDSRVTAEEDLAITDLAKARAEEFRPVVDEFKNLLSREAERTGSIEAALQSLGIERDRALAILGSTDVEQGRMAIWAGDTEEDRTRGAIIAASKNRELEQLDATAKIKRDQEELNEIYRLSQKSVDTLALRLRNMNVAIAEAGNATIGFQAVLSNIASGRTQVTATPLLDIQNYRALSSEQIAERIGQVRSFTGDARGLSEAESLIQQSRAFEQVSIQAIREAISSEQFAGEGAADFIRALKADERFAGFDTRFVDALATAVGQSDLRQSDPEEFSRLLDDPNFADKITAQVITEAVNLVNSSVAQVNTALGQFTEALNINVQQQLEASALQDSINQAQFNAANRIRELRGETISSDELRNQRLSLVTSATSRAGIGPTIDPRQIAEEIRNLRRENDRLNAQPATEEGQVKLAANTARMGELNKALQGLTGEISELSAIEKEIGDIERQKAGLDNISDLLARAGLGDMEAAGRIARAQTALKRAQAGIAPQSIEELDALQDSLRLLGDAIPEDKRRDLDRLVRTRVAQVGAGAFAGGDPRRFKEIQGLLLGEELDEKREGLLAKVARFEEERANAMRAQHALAMDEIREVGNIASELIRTAGVELTRAMSDVGGRGFLSGGYIDGAYKGHRDTELIMAQPGEFVVNRKAAQKHGNLLEAINSGATVDGFARGGYIGRQGFINNFAALREREDRISLMKRMRNSRRERHIPEGMDEPFDPLRFRREKDGSVVFRTPEEVARAEMTAAAKRWARERRENPRSTAEYLDSLKYVRRETNKNRNRTSEENMFRLGYIRSKSGKYIKRNIDDIFGLLNGGTIGGKYRGNTDSELIMAQPGEFVVNRRDARRNYHLLNRINSGKKLKGFQTGGVVGGASVTTAGSGMINLGAPSLQALSAFASASAQLGTALGQLSNLTTVSQNLSSALQQLGRINIPSRIEITSAPIQHNVIINGVEAFANMEPVIRDMVVTAMNNQINKTVNPITGETQEGIGQRITK